jgi:hypothetical protein
MAYTEVQKIDFIRSISPETKLIDDVLIPVFENIKQYKVIKTHGMNENGKDIVLINDNPLGKKAYTAVIVKNEGITNASTSKDKEIVATVSTQIVMCIDSGFYSIEENKKVNFNDIIVITSKGISNSARQQFIDIANQHRFTNISFWETKEIIEYVDKYLPEIYLVSSGVLSKYFHIIKEKCESLNELKKIAIYNNAERHLSDVYIEPILFNKSDKIVNGKATTIYNQSTLSKILKNNGHYLITGAAGAGKSTLIRSEIYRMILDYENRRDDKLPVFIKIKNLIKYYIDSNNHNIICNYLCDEFQLSKEETEYLLSKKDNLIFFFDGYDELASQNEKDTFFKILDYIEGCLGCSIIVTSRKIPFGIKDNFSSYNKWDLADFNITQITNFFKKWFKSQNEKLIADLKDHDLLEKLPNTPLVMTLIAILFESDNNVEIPSNLSELYRMFVDLLVGRWNLDRRIDSFYKANDKETFLTNLALYMQYNNKISCSEYELQKVFTNTAKDLGRTFNNELMKDEIIKDTNLLVINDNGEYEFRHLSFQEYFVGTYLTMSGNVHEIIEKVPHPWWSQVLYFYCGTRKINDDILPAIFESINKKDTKEKLLGIYEFGYLIQSSYKTKAQIRTSLITNAIIEYSNIIINVLNNIEDETLKKVPEIIRYLSLIEAFRMHYSSHFLIEIYQSIYEEMKKLKYDSFEKSFSLFLLTTIIASNGKVDVLADSDHVFKEYPLLLLMEEFLIRCNLLEEISDKEQLAIIKEQSRLISKRIRNNRSLYKNILEKYSA